MAHIGSESQWVATASMTSEARIHVRLCCLLGCVFEVEQNQC